MHSIRMKVKNVLFSKESFGSKKERFGQFPKRPSVEINRRIFHDSHFPPIYWNDVRCCCLWKGLNFLCLNTFSSLMWLFYSDT